MSRSPSLLSVFFFSIFIFTPLFSQESNSSDSIEKVSFRGSLVNGTKKPFRSFPELQLVRLDKKMSVVEKIFPKRSHFSFSPVKKPRVPYLIRSSYEGANYSLIIPPQEKFWKKKHILYLYEGGGSLKGLKSNVGLQVTKVKDRLSIQKIYVLNNITSPPRSIALDKICFFIPGEALNVQASIQYFSTFVRIPLTVLTKEKCGYRFKHGLRPEQLELSIYYEMPGYFLKDRKFSFIELKELDVPRKNLQKSQGPYILSWKPSSVTPKVRGAKYKSFSSPGLGTVYHVFYEASKMVEYDFSSGSIFISDPIKMKQNPVFDTVGKTVAALFILLIYYCIFLRSFLKYRLKKNNLFFVSRETKK